MPTVDADRITELVEDATSGKGAPVDASVELVNGQPKVVPSKPGVTFDPDDITTTFLDLVARPEGDRVLEVEATVDEADFTTRDARELGVKEKISEFTTYFPYAEYRNINIGRAAEIVDGTLLKPGDTFSLNGVVGERTGENGFTTGFIISNGIFKEDLGGGVSQMATTDVQRDVLRRPQGHRAQAALLLHRPLPGGPRGDGGLADPRPALPERHRVRRADRGVRQRRHRRPRRAR